MTTRDQYLESRVKFDARNKLGISSVGCTSSLKLLVSLMKLICTRFSVHARIKSSCCGQNRSDSGEKLCEIVLRPERG